MQTQFWKVKTGIDEVVFYPGYDMMNISPFASHFYI